MLPCVALALPTLMTRLTRSGDYVETPGFATRACIVGGDEPANTKLSTSDTDDDLILDHERRNGHRVAGVRIRDLRLPEGTPGLCIECDEIRIERRQEQCVSEDRESTIHGPAARFNVLRRKVSI